MKLRTILRRTIWTIVVLATIIALFYTEEDWRGARALRAVEKEYQQAGISLNFADYVPKPIPDSENLGALPVFALTPYSPHEPYLYPHALAQAVRSDEHLSSLPSLGAWKRGQLVDFNSIDSGVARIYSEVFKTHPPVSPRAQLDMLFPVLQYLRQASATRTQCRFNEDFSVDPPFARPATLITLQINLARLLVIHGLLALHEREPDLALEDLRTILILAKGAEHSPSLVAQLIAIGIRTIGDVLVYNGLAEHAWSVPQLTQLQENLGSEDFLLSFQFGLKTEAAAFARLFQIIRANPSNWVKLVTVGDIQHPKRWVDYIFPVGWIDSNESGHLRFLLELTSVPDSNNRTLSPRKVKVLFDDLMANAPLWKPWNVLAFTASKPFIYLPRNFAIAQTTVNQSMIACAIERYRSTHASYPLSLGALVPLYLAAVPHDVINGQPYHYRLKPDGSYLLYSVGWNETDDGGTVVLDKNDPQHHRIDYDQGDWVWFGPK